MIKEVEVELDDEELISELAGSKTIEEVYIDWPVSEEKDNLWDTLINDYFDDNSPSEILDRIDDDEEIAALIIDRVELDDILKHADRADVANWLLGNIK